MNLLSIDWDFFMKLDEVERYYLFPDGGNENLPSSILDIIWATKYTTKVPEGKRNLIDISIDREEINKIVDFIINNAEKGAKLVVADSHLGISSLLKSGGWETVVNIDFHHDCYKLHEDSPDGSILVNCGNWARVYGDYNFYDQLYWVKREDSAVDDMVIDADALGGIYGFEFLNNYQGLDLFDTIFICRSGAWSPPHLDKEFWEFIKTIEKTIYTKVKTNNIRRGDNRYSAEFRKYVEKESKALSAYYGLS